MEDMSERTEGSEIGDQKRPRIIDHASKHFPDLAAREYKLLGLFFVI